jgi:hypothetical protein
MCKNNKKQKDQCLFGKMCEMQKVSEVFKSNFNYIQRVAHKKLS